MSLKAFLDITRPHNCALAGIVGVLGAVVATGSLPAFRKLVLVFLVVHLGCSAGNTLNDYFDYEIDRINRPRRVLPRGGMKRVTALYYAITLFAVGLVLATFINLPSFLLAVAAYVTMFLYAWKLKPMPFLGNVAVASLTGVTPLYGALAMEKIGLVGTLSLCAFLINVAREVIKDIEDVEGDMASGARTLPIVIGKKKAAYVGAAFAFATVVASFIPVTAGIGLGYWAMMPVDAMITYAGIRVMLRQDGRSVHVAQQILKVSILLAVMAFLIAALIT